MAPGNAQLHDRFCLSEKAIRKTKHRSFLVLTKGLLNIFGNEHVLLETDH